MNRRFVREQGATYPSLVDADGRTAIAYGIFGVPETFFLDANGTVVSKYVGPLDDERLAAELGKAGVRR